MTPLMLAVLGGEGGEGVVRVVVKEGAGAVDLGARSANGRTVLEMARGKGPVVAVLLEAVAKRRGSVGKELELESAVVGAGGVTGA